LFQTLKHLTILFHAYREGEGPLATQIETDGTALLLYMGGTKLSIRNLNPSDGSLLVPNWRMR
jgi:hypothetical protein